MMSNSWSLKSEHVYDIDFSDGEDLSCHYSCISQMQPIVSLTPKDWMKIECLVYLVFFCRNVVLTL